MNDHSTEANPELQKIADRYILEEIIGEGSYSIVFRGYDTEYHRKVAIKELKSQGLTKEEANEAQTLFFNEINILKQLSHVNIPAVYDFFLFEGRHYMVMQWVEGRNLLSFIENGETLSQGEALYYMRQITDALIYLQAEERRIIYKDLKPSNIIVTDNGHIWIIDFGTARFYSPEKKKDTHVLGTPGYAPPEAYTGAQTDLSADIYSLGATFYHLVTGQEPFQFKFSFPSPCKFKPELTQKFSSLLLACLKPRDARIPNAVDLKRHIDNLDPEFFQTGNKEKFNSTDTGSLMDLFSLFKGSGLYIVTLLFSFFYVSGSEKTDSNIGCCSFLYFVIIFSLLVFPIYFLSVKSKKGFKDYIFSFVLVLLVLFIINIFCYQEATRILFLTTVPILMINAVINYLFEEFEINLNKYVQLLLAMEIYVLANDLLFQGIILDYYVRLLQGNGTVFLR